ncbi:hypothetical protein [Halobacillus salinus]|uniref:hypothetical protein n=1 Tax=Halobacillus salinus TaxID=192814 RepID=UPI0009A66CD7|nr:hypothetical protein [Halobacillus salinus]
MDKEKLFKTIAITSLVVCLAVWIPNVIFQVASPLWMATFLIAPIGITFSILIKKYWLVVSNVIMLFSFFLFMFAGYLVNFLTDGKP